MENLNDILGFRYGMTSEGRILDIVEINEVYVGGRCETKCKGNIHIGTGVKMPAQAFNIDRYGWTFINEKLTPISKFLDYEYKDEKLEKKDIICKLNETLYLWDPNLQGKTLLGWDYKNLGIEHDPNYYYGNYILNDGNVYSIIKDGKKIYYVKGEVSYTYAMVLHKEREGNPDYVDENLLYEGEIKFDIYKLSKEYTHMIHVMNHMPHQYYLQGKDNTMRMWKLYDIVVRNIEKINEKVSG